MPTTGDLLATKNGDVFLYISNSIIMNPGPLYKRGAVVKLTLYKKNENPMFSGVSENWEAFGHIINALTTIGHLDINLTRHDLWDTDELFWHLFANHEEFWNIAFSLYEKNILNSDLSKTDSGKTGGKKI